MGEIGDEVVRENVGGMGGDWGEYMYFGGMVGA